MQKRRLLIISTAVLLLLGCQLASLLRTSGPANLSAHGVQRQDAIVLVDGQPRTLDPARTLGGPDSALGHIFSGLVTLDTALQVQPDLAAGWEVSDDRLTYTFFLRKNAVFHNGRPVTAQDVIFSWERAADPAVGSDTVQTYLGDIAGVNAKLTGAAERISGLRALDDHTLEVRLTAPVVVFLAKLAYPVAFVVDRENVGAPNWEYRANGTGPFMLQSWRDDEIIVLARNPLYYGEPARVSHLVYDLGASLPLSQYETDQIDLVYIGGGALEAALDPNNPLNAELRQVVDLCTTVIGLNNRIPPFDDARVRRAFNYALDKERLVATFMSGNALVAQGALPPGMPGYGGLDGVSYPYDPERARALLAEAGYADPADLGTLTYSTAGYGDAGPFVTAVVTLWQETLGVAIAPVVLEPFTYYDALFAGNVGNFFSSGWCADYPDPQNFLDVLYHSGSRQNIGGFSHAETDRLLESARVEPDTAVRLAAYQAAERLIVQEAPVVFMSHSTTAVLVKPWLQGYVLTPMGVAQWQHVSIQR